MNYTKIKICSKCGFIKPIEEFVKNKKSKDGYRIVCKKCFNKNLRKKYWEDENYRKKDIEKCRKYRKNHRDEINNKVRYKYNNDEDFRQKVLGWRKRYVKNNKISESEYRKNYIKPDYYLIKDRNRHARNNMIMEPTDEHYITMDDWHELINKQNNCCNMCGKSFDEVKPTIDHIIPLSEGGLHLKENIQLLCRSCNSIKGTKIL